jgi:glutaredoxin-related protein
MVKLMPKRVEMYTSRNCHPCVTARTYFHDHAIDCKMIDVEKIDVSEANIKSVPTIRCWEGIALVAEYTGFGMITGQKIREWYNNYD